MRLTVAGIEALCEDSRRPTSPLFHLRRVMEMFLGVSNPAPNPSPSALTMARQFVADMFDLSHASRRAAMMSADGTVHRTRAPMLVHTRAAMAAASEHLRRANKKRAFGWRDAQKLVASGHASGSTPRKQGTASRRRYRTRGNEALSHLMQSLARTVPHLVHKDRHVNKVRCLIPTCSTCRPPAHTFVQTILAFNARRVKAYVRSRRKIRRESVSYAPVAAQRDLPTLRCDLGRGTLLESDGSRRLMFKRVVHIATTSTHKAMGLDPPLSDVLAPAVASGDPTAPKRGPASMGEAAQALLAAWDVEASSTPVEAAVVDVGAVSGSSVCGGTTTVAAVRSGATSGWQCVPFVLGLAVAPSVDTPRDASCDDGGDSDDDMSDSSDWVDLAQPTGSPVASPTAGACSSTASSGVASGPALHIPSPPVVQAPDAETTPALHYAALARACRLGSSGRSGKAHQLSKRFCDAYIVVLPTVPAMPRSWPLMFVKRNVATDDQIHIG